MERNFREDTDGQIESESSSKKLDLAEENEQAHKLGVATLQAEQK